MNRFLRNKEYPVVPSDHIVHKVTKYVFSLLNSTDYDIT
jgi:hypothetical protein